MANKFTRFLQDVLVGALAPKGNMADFQHAARLYVDNTFRLAPKTKFLYYVVFNMNPEAIAGTAFQDQNRLEVNYLVKRVDLPKYTLNTEELNQYNRKTRSYTKITYEPVNLVFHDDNAGVTNSLWALYYGYYFRDRLNSSDPYDDINPPAYQNTAVTSKETQPFRYGLDNNVGDPFFRSIQLITMAQHRFYSYLLCNPKVLSWSHDTVDQSDGAGILQNEMTLGYDAVIYSSGKVEVGDPAGFAQLHYDTVPSPLGTVSSEDIFGDVFATSGFGGPNTYIDRVRDPNLNYGNIGNRAPFGFGTPPLLNRPQSYYYSNRSSSGLQNYNFGSANAFAVATGAAVGGAVAGIFNGFDKSQNGPDNKVDRSFVTGSSNRSTGLQTQFNTVAGNQAQDVGVPELPINISGNRSQQAQRFSNESIRLNSGDNSRSLQSQSSEPITLANYGAGDSPAPNNANELLTNNPGNRDLPSSPWG